MKRIAVVKSNYTPFGGAEKYTTRIVNAFVERGCKVDILTSSQLRWEGLNKDVSAVHLKQFPYNSFMKLLTFNRSVAKYLDEHNYDCVFGMDRTDRVTHLRAGGGCHAAWLDRRCKESSKVRCASFRVNPFHRLSVEIESRAFLSPSVKDIFCNSAMVRDEIENYYPGSIEKLSIVHNGVEWDEFEVPFLKGQENKRAILRDMSLDDGKFYFLYLGSGYERKGASKAISAMKYLPYDTRLLIVGKDKHEMKYRRLADKLGLDARVQFFGPQKNVLPFLQVSDAFVLPTLYDPFSNATLESLAMGLYAITSNANGCAEVIKDGAGTVIADLSEVGSVADAMKLALTDRLTKQEIRDSVKHLAFQDQLNKIVDRTISQK